MQLRKKPKLPSPVFSSDEKESEDQEWNKSVESQEGYYVKRDNVNYLSDGDEANPISCEDELARRSIVESTDREYIQQRQQEIQEEVQQVANNSEAMSQNNTNSDL